MDKRCDRGYKPERTLQARILSGYILLTILVLGIISAVWYEKQVLRHAETEELTMLEQRNCIDSVCNLLTEKEQQMAVVLDLLENMPDVGEIVNRKIPAIVGQTEEQPSPEAATTIEPPATGNKKRNLWSFFKKKGKKSAYARQKEKMETAGKIRAAGTQHPISPSLLYSLEKEISDTTRLYEERLSTEIDSLRTQNQRLDGRIGALIQHFEKKEADSLSREIQAQQDLRNRSFRLITGIGIGTFLLVIILYMVIHRDVNRQHKTRMELEASNRKNEELSQSRQNILLTVSHDLCAPLSTINGYAELIPEEKDEAQRNRYAENILNASHHVIGLANKKGLGLTVETEGVNTMVEGDRIRLTQILNNLLTNAVKFTPVGYVHVGVRYADGWLCFFVRDTGTGISEDRPKNLFKAFERLDADNPQPGFGLGLSITARLVSLLGGTVSVESREGHGSTFEVRLPMQEAGGPETGSVQRVEYARLSGLRAVLIDDDRIQADMTRRMLARSGVACDCCHDVKELTELLRGRRYDLLLTDMQMPEADGYTVLALLRNSNLGQSKEIPVLTVTARADGEREQLKRDGFAGYLHKPFSMDELLSAVAECTGGRIPQRKGPDFTALLEGEDDREEILDMFVQDMEKTTADLKKAIGTKDYAGIIALIHKGTPLWETIRMDIPVQELERLASLAPEAWDEAAVAEVWKLVTTVDEAVEKAKELKDGME